MRQRTQPFRPMSTRRVFALRLARNALLSAGLVACALGIGAVGYHELVDLDWLDATRNASMILTGMGPLAPRTTVEAELFGIFYSLFGGVAFLTFVAVLFGPVLHRFHLDVVEEVPATPRPDPPRQGPTDGSF